MGVEVGLADIDVCDDYGGAESRSCVDSLLGCGVSPALPFRVRRNCWDGLTPLHDGPAF